jgi:hypothetical protein
VLDPVSEPSITALYEETGRVIAQFWGWRHKVIALCGAMITTILAIAAWMYQRHLGGAVAIPFAFGAMVAYGCAIFDQRNAEIIADCFQIAKTLEEQGAQRAPGRGIYGALWLSKPDAEAKGRTYTQTLAKGYRGVAALLILCGIVIVTLAVVEPSTITPAAAP